MDLQLQLLREGEGSPRVPRGAGVAGAAAAREARGGEREVAALDPRTAMAERLRREQLEEAQEIDRRRRAAAQRDSPAQQVRVVFVGDYVQFAAAFPERHSCAFACSPSATGPADRGGGRAQASRRDA